MRMKTKTLKEVIQFKNGKKRPIIDGNIPVYGGNGVLGYANNSNYERCIIIGRVGAYCGSVYLEDNKCWVSDNAIAAQPLGENDIRFLYYLLKGLRLNERHIGTSQPLLTQEILNKIECVVPSPPVQKRIAALLGSFDDKISANKRINDNLEQQAQAIFANMFDESNTTQATISDVSLNVTDGVHNTVHDDPEGEYLLLSCKNIKGGSLNIGTSERRISRDTFEKLRRRTKLSKGDVLISSVGTIGELLLLNNEPLNYEFQRSVAMVKPNPSVVSSAYLYESLLSNRAKLINSAHGAVQQCLFISDIAEFPIRIPQQDILSEFDTIVTPMLDIVTANENENIKLSQLRDTLLPKLMSGEIDVSDLEF